MKVRAKDKKSISQLPIRLKHQQITAIFVHGKKIHALTRQNGIHTLNDNFIKFCLIS
jgi:hypothetical protein